MLNFLTSNAPLWFDVWRRKCKLATDKFYRNLRFLLWTNLKLNCHQLTVKLCLPSSLFIYINYNFIKALTDKATYWAAQ